MKQTKEPKYDVMLLSVLKIAHYEYICTIFKSLFELTTTKEAVPVCICQCVYVSVYM